MSSDEREALRRIIEQQKKDGLSAEAKRLIAAEVERTEALRARLLTQREAATVVAALMYYAARSIDVLMSVKLPDSLGREVPLTRDEVEALVRRVIEGGVFRQEGDA